MAAPRCPNEHRQGLTACLRRGFERDPQILRRRVFSQGCSTRRDRPVQRPRTKSLLIAHHALLSGNPANFAVLKMVAKDPGDPLDKPWAP